MPESSVPFPTTRWSLVARAADRAGGGTALEDLLVQYARPMRRYLTARWHVRPEAIDDLLQTFIADKILQQEALTKADAARGRFRSFLISVLDNFAANYFRDERRLKRGSGEVTTAANLDHTGDATPDPATAFDIEWARQVLHRAVDQMRTECEQSGRADVWGVFEARILGPTLHQLPPVAYGELVQRFGLVSPERASNLLMTAKRTFARCLRGVISEYEDDPAEVEAEIADLQNVLARA